MPYATRTPGMNTVDSLLTDTSLRRPPRNNGHLEVAPTFLYSFNAIGVYEINHIRTAGKNQMKNDPRSCERNVYNCLRSLEKKKSGLQRCSRVNIAKWLVQIPLKS